MKFIRVLVFVFFCVFLCFVFGTKVSAQECTNINESEFHSLRPYPGKPCLDVISETATFCGDSLTITDNIPITYRPSVDSCISIPGGKVRCTYSKNQNRNITINLSEAELPIMGNTEDVTPNASPDMSDAQKVNEYVSWYLNGVINRKEYPEKTDNTSLVNFSGPIAKLLPQQIQQAERVRTIERGTGKDVNGDGETSPRDRHNQIAVCYKIENDLNFLPSILRWALEHLGIGKAVPADCPGNDKMRLDEWNGHLSFYNQIIATGLNLAEFFAKLMPSVASDAIEGALADNEPWPYRVPPLPWGNAPSGEPFDSLTYQKAYNEWLGKTCLLIPFPRFLICTENFLVPNIYADLFPFVPLSSTEDRKGEVTAAGSVGSAPGVTISNVSTSFTNATLYFAHMQEATELASTLQDTFTYKGADKFATGNSVPVNTAGSCKIVDVRSNAGDSLMPSPSSITGNIAYTATFTCDFNSSSSCSGTCVPSQLECRDGGGTGGTGSCSGNWYCCNFSAPTPPAEQNCTKVIPITINTTTETPIADKIWAQLVSGTSSVFRRIFPKLGSGSQIGEVKDIPASTKVTYSGDVSGNGELKFPHIGGISEYFLKGIQTMLRPKGYGEAISFGETTGTTTCGDIPDLPAGSGDCKLTSTLIGGITLPPTMVSILEAAAQNYNVPPGLILGVMFGESAFNPGRYDWTDENVKKWATCEPFPGCNPSENVIKNVVWFAKNEWDSIISKGIEKDIKALDPNREVDGCNLLDGIYGLAWLSRDNVDGGAFALPKCFGVDLNFNGSTTNGCDWKNNDYETVIKMWESGTTDMCFTKENSCATGGGVSAACPTGGDTCETIINRYSRPSHNGCVWDVAHSH